MKILEGEEPKNKGDKIKYTVEMKGAKHGTGEEENRSEDKTDQTSNSES